jgi:hypothetical protein
MNRTWKQLAHAQRVQRSLAAFWQKVGLDDVIREELAESERHLKQQMDAARRRDFRRQRGLEP